MHRLFRCLRALTVSLLDPAQQLAKYSTVSRFSLRARYRTKNCIRHSIQNYRGSHQLIDGDGDFGMSVRRRVGSADSAHTPPGRSLVGINTGTMSDLLAESVRMVRVG